MLKKGLLVIEENVLTIATVCTPFDEATMVCWIRASVCHSFLDHVDCILFYLLIYVFFLGGGAPLCG